METILKIENLHCQVQDQEILKGLNLEIKKGEVHAIKEKIAFTKSIFTGAINKPTAHVKITNDITRGFIRLKKALT